MNGEWWWFDGLGSTVSVSECMSRFAIRSANRVNYDAVLARGDKPDRRVQSPCLLPRLRRRLAACRRCFKL